MGVTATLGNLDSGQACTLAAPSKTLEKGSQHSSPPTPGGNWQPWHLTVGCQLLYPLPGLPPFLWPLNSNPWAKQPPGMWFCP